MAPPAGIAGKAVSAMPADAYTLSRLPLRNVCSNRVDASGDFVARNTRILQSGETRFFYDSVTVAHAAGFHFDPNLSATGFRNWTVYDFKVSAGFVDLNNFHDFFLKSAEIGIGCRGGSTLPCYRWQRVPWRCRNASDQSRYGTSAMLAPTSILLVSLRDEVGDGTVGCGQRCLVGQKHDAEVTGAGLLAKARTVDHQHVLGPA